jgi:hypothetical protein
LPCQKAAVKTLLYRDSKVGGRMEYFVQQLINGITLGSILQSHRLMAIANRTYGL